MRPRRRRHSWGTPNAQVTPTTGPIEMDLDALLRAATSAPSHRATTTTEIQIQSSSWGRNVITLYDGRKRITRLEAGRVVIITYEPYGWRISTSLTAEPTPVLLRQGSVPPGADKISESGGRSLYQTPTSLLIAAQYQATHNRRSIALAMMDQAITLKAKHATDSQVASVEKRYNVFCNLAARALGGSHSDVDSGVTEGITQEAQSAWMIAVKRGSQLIEGEWQ
jgi:nitroreductase